MYASGECQNFLKELEYSNISVQVHHSRAHFRSRFQHFSSGDLYWIIFVVQ